MNKFVKVGLVFAILVMVVLITDHLTTPQYAIVGFTSDSIFAPRQVPPTMINVDSYHYSFVGDMQLYYKVKTILSSVNATLLVILLAAYSDMYIKLKSEFTFGLIVFSLILLLYALSSNPLFQFLFGYQAFGLGPFAMLPDMFTSLALAVLLYLTMK